MALLVGVATRQQVTPSAPREFVNGDAVESEFDAEHPRDPETGRFIDEP